MIDVAPQAAAARPEAEGALNLARRHETSARRVLADSIGYHWLYKRHRAKIRAQRHREKAQKLRRRAAILDSKAEKPPTLHDIEMRYIQFVLRKHDGNKTAAARELGISLKTLYNKIHQHQHMREQWLGSKGATA